MKYFQILLVGIVMMFGFSSCGDKDKVEKQKEYNFMSALIDSTIKFSTSNVSAVNNGNNVVITGSSGSIAFNITVPTTGLADESKLNLNNTTCTITFTEANVLFTNTTTGMLYIADYSSFEDQRRISGSFSFIAVNDPAGSRTITNGQFSVWY